MINSIALKFKDLVKKLFYVGTPAPRPRRCGHFHEVVLTHISKKILKKNLGRGTWMFTLVAWEV